MDIQRVGVVGCGLMGSGIVEVVAKAGFDVVVREIDSASVEAGMQRVSTSMDRAVAREKLSVEERDAALSRTTFVTELSDLGECDLVIEAIVEDLAAKRQLFQALHTICASETIFASNTSSLAITDISASTRPTRFVGLHFFNPVPVMKLVEVVRTISTDDQTFEAAMSFSRALGKEPIPTKDNSGFVVNLLLVPFMLDAIRQLERGVATVEDFDKALTMGAGHPMGPFMLCDFVGIDTVLRISEIMHDEYSDPRYAPPPLLRRLTALGRFGRKTGAGFYDWSGEEPTPLL